MGRGRQKAKHTKVARELKYFSPDTDLSALERELGASSAKPEDEFVDRWADLYADEDDEDDDDDTAGDTASPSSQRPGETGAIS